MKTCFNIFVFLILVAFSQSCFIPDFYPCVLGCPGQTYSTCCITFGCTTIVDSNNCIVQVCGGENTNTNTNKQVLSLQSTEIQSCKCSCNGCCFGQAKYEITQNCKQRCMSQLSCTNNTCENECECNCLIQNSCGCKTEQ